MKNNKINILFTFIIIYSLFLGSIYLEAASLITKTTFNKMNESLTTIYNNFDENDKYLTNGPFICSGDRIRCTGSYINIGTLSKREYEIIGSNSYLSAKNSNNKYWTNNKNGSNAYVVNINSIEEKPQTDSYGIRGSVYVKNETTFAGNGTRIDPYVLNYTQQTKQDINLVAFYVDSDGDGSFEDEPNNGRVDKIDQGTAYSLVSSVCTDSTGQEFTEMITYNDNNKSILISPVQYQLSCTIKLKIMPPLPVMVMGGYSSFVLDTNGYLWSWGRNYCCELGLGLSAGTTQKQPEKIENYTWKSISSKGSYVLAIDKEGYLWSWGDDYKGRLGLGSTGNYNTPQKVGNKKWKVASASYGSGSSFAIDEEGYLWSWGSNFSGQLGLGSRTDYDTPQKVGNEKWKSVSGDSSTLAIDEEGYLWSWGANVNGELGLGTTTRIYNSPQKIGSKKWKLVSAGSVHTAAIDEEGYLWSWGYNGHGALGIGSSTLYFKTPQKVENGRWKTISVEGYNSLGIDEEYNLWSWGYNGWYQLGNGTTNDEYTPYNLTLNGYFGK